MKSESECGSPSRVTTILKSRAFHRKKTIVLDQPSEPVENIEHIKAFLELPLYKRIEHFSSIKESVFSMKFFNQLRRDQSLDAVVLMWRHCKHEYFQASRVIFQEGDTDGTKFYVILKGVVSVLKNREDSPGKREVALISHGQSFGDRAMMLNMPRTASIRTKTNCHLISIEFKDYKQVLKKTIEDQHSALSSFLGRLPTLQSQSRKSLIKLAYDFQKAVFLKDFVLFSEGDQVKGIYYLYQGSIKITKTVSVASNTNGNYPYKQSSLHTKYISEEFFITSLGEGQLIGSEEVVLNAKTREFTYICVEDCILYSINIENFVEHILSGPQSHLIVEQVKQAYRFRQKMLEQRVRILKSKYAVRPFEMEFQTPQPPPRKRHKSSLSQTAYIYTPRSKVIVKNNSPQRVRKRPQVERAQFLGQESKSPAKVRRLITATKPLRRYNSTMVNQQKLKLMNASNISLLNKCFD